MDIIEVKKERWKLDRKIEELLKEFAKTTTMHVTSIKVGDAPGVYRSGYKVFTYVEL